MPERKRAYHGGAVVTVLKGKIGGRGKTTIRNQFGFETQVPAKELEPIPASDAKSKLRYGGNEPEE